RWPDSALEQEARLFDTKWYAALAYIRANRLNHNVIEGPNDRFGIIASGKAYNDTRQALIDLGLDDDTCRRIGLRLHKVNVVWPLEATITREFAEGLDEILVVEEKRQVIEYQLKEELYGWRPDVRPNVLGKFDDSDDDRGGGEWSQANPSQHRLALHGGLDGSIDGELFADGRRRRVVGRPGAVHDRPAHLRQPRRRHLLPLGAARGSAGDRGQGQHHLQDPVQRRRRDDRRPADRRHDAGARDDARARRRGR